MKRIAIISLVVVFLTANYAYATFPLEEFAERIENSQYQEMTQEEIEEIFVALLSAIDRVLVDRESIDWGGFIEKVEETQDLEPLLNQEACDACLVSIQMPVTGLLLIEVGGPVAVIGLFVLVASLGLIIHIIPYCYMCFFT